MGIIAGTKKPIGIKETGIKYTQYLSGELN